MYSSLEFLKDLEEAVWDNDRYMIATLEGIAHALQEYQWLEAIRWADNYLVGCQRGNKVIKELSELKYEQLAIQIRRQHASQTNDRSPRFRRAGDED